MTNEQFTIKNIQGGDIVTVEIECGENCNEARELGLAVIQAIKQRVDLYCADLQDANLQRADLQRANMQDANLQRADLQRANMQRTDLYGANMQRTNLQRANLRDADLQRANLHLANLRDADLQRANLRYANLRYANLQDADLQGANLYGADMRYAKLQGANLRDVNLLCMGDMRFIKTLQIDTWAIGYTHDTLQIGCQSHAIDKWRKWNTEAGRKWIDKMDQKALEWADKHLDIILKIIDASPAEKPQ